MSGMFSISERRAYGISRVCRIWGVSRASYYRHIAPVPSPANSSRRRGPVGAMKDEALVKEIQKLIKASPFYGEGYRKLWARLRYKGIFTSKERVRRLMRDYNLSAWLGQGTPRGSKAHDGTIIPETIDTMWGTDMTTTVTTDEGQVAVFIAYDHCSAECVGIHASKAQNRFEALEPIRQGVRHSFGAIGVRSGRGQNDTLRVFPMSFHNICDSVFANAKIPCNPAIASALGNCFNHLWSQFIRFWTVPLLATKLFAACTGGSETRFDAFTQ